MTLAPTRRKPFKAHVKALHEHLHIRAVRAETEKQRRATIRKERDRQQGLMGLLRRTFA